MMEAERGDVSNWHSLGPLGTFPPLTCRRVIYDIVPESVLAVCDFGQNHISLASLSSLSVTDSLCVFLLDSPTP